VTIIWLLLTLIPTLVEGYLDRRGESKKGKVKDTLWLIVVAVGIAGGAWLAGNDPLPVIGLIIGWRILVFDYLVTWLLIRNDVINPNAKWWDYTGKTSKIDQWVSKIDWKVRLLIRCLLFVLSVALFLWL